MLYEVASLIELESESLLEEDNSEGKMDSSNFNYLQDALHHCRESEEIEYLPEQNKEYLPTELPTFEALFASLDEP